ncbi:MAG: protein kinase [Anaerolineae bacterium]|nr:protein kinase [Anaerolineae bacterium]
MPGNNLIGQQLGEFIIHDRLGQGAMATVYLAVQPSVNNREVALKVIRLDTGQEHEFRQRFAREVAVIAKLEHIHILPVYAYGISDDYVYLATRWLKGGTLAQLMRDEPLSLERIAHIINQVAAGLTYAHQKGVIHRDIKPSNIMLDDAGNAYLTDFGLAKAIENPHDLTLSGTVVGTPAYMSPEQLRSDPLDARSDIYSLGILLYNLVVGQLPFDPATSDIVSVIYQHLEKEPPPPREINANISPEIEAVILRALAKSPEGRYSSAVELARAFSAAVGLPGSSEQSLPRLPYIQPTPAAARTSLSLRRFTLIGVALVTVIIVGILLGSFIAGGLGQQTPQITILAGESLTSAEIPVPSEDEIAAARRYVGANGFIAYLACNRNSGFHSVLARVMADMATSDQIQLRLYDPENDKYSQVTQIEQARSDGARALIICPLDVGLLRESLQSVQAAHLPLVIFGSEIPNYGGILVGNTDYALGVVPGEMAGQIIRDEMDGQADVIILDFPDREDIVRRADGLEAGVLEFAPDATIVGRYRGATREFGYESVKKLIDDGVHFDVIVSINDAGTFGAIQAMDEAGFAPDSVVIISIDAEALALEYIQEGHFIRGTAATSPGSIGEVLFNTMIRLLSGAPMPEKVFTPAAEMVTAETLAAAGQ